MSVRRGRPNESETRGASPGLGAMAPFRALAGVLAAALALSACDVRALLRKLDARVDAGGSDASLDAATARDAAADASATADAAADAPAQKGLTVDMGGDFGANGPPGPCPAGAGADAGCSGTAGDVELPPGVPNDIARLRPALRRCYAKALAAHPQSGTVVFTVTLETDGAAKTVEARSSGLDTDVIACARDAMKRHFFDPSTSEERTYRFLARFGRVK